MNEAYVLILRRIGKIPDAQAVAERNTKPAMPKKLKVDFHQKYTLLKDALAAQHDYGFQTPVCPTPHLLHAHAHACKQAHLQ